MATTTSVSVTATTTSGSNATPSCASQLILDVPDIACGIPNNKDYASALKDCAKDAPVETYANDCGIYALVVGQTVGELTQCLQDADVKPGDIQCNGQTTATATNTELPSKTGSASETESATKTDGSASPTESDGAAGSLKEHSPSKFALSVMGFLVCALTAGASL